MQTIPEKLHKKEGRRETIRKVKQREPLPLQAIEQFMTASNKNSGKFIPGSITSSILPKAIEKKITTPKSNKVQANKKNVVGNATRGAGSMKRQPTLAEQFS